MDSRKCTCEHKTKLTADERINCAMCNAFISRIDGHAAIKDQSLGGMHQIFPQMMFQRLLTERSVLKHSLQLYMSGTYDKVRTLLVDWLELMRGKLGLSESVLHLAVKYMDYILLQKEYSNSKYQLIALCCLAIAAKYDELDRNIPFPEDFTRLAKLPFRTFVLAECEMLLLKVLDWQLKVSTPYEVSHCLLSQGVLFDDDTIENKGLAPQEAHAILLTRIVKHLVLDTLRCNFQL